MNKQIEELYNKLDAQDKIINTQALEIARLKDKIDKAIEYIKSNELDIVMVELLEILGEKEMKYKLVPDKNGTIILGNKRYKMVKYE